MPFNIIRNDITQLDTDAIVNAANERLLAGGGVCGAIFAEAGKEELQKACDKIGYCKTGDAVITKGYNLRAKYIIHTVGPVYGNDPKNEEAQLYSCYERSLMLAKKKGLSSIAFPVISSGIYGYPKAEAIKIATRAIKDFLEKHEMNVFLVVYDKNAFKISEKLFSAVESFIDERMVKYGFHGRVCESKALEETLCETRVSMHEADFYVPSCARSEYNEETPHKSSRMPKSSFKKHRTLDELLHRDVETFSQMLFRLIDEKGMTDVEVYKRANIDRKLFSKIRKKDYTPKKTTVMALIIALRLEMGEAKELLSRAGFAFSKGSKFDIIIEFFIENKNYDIFEINETLFAFEQQCLGA